MHQHASTCLRGPVSRSRHSWNVAPVQVKERKRRTSRKAPAEDIRHDLVARVRQEIAAGTYDTPEKWQAALERLLERHLPG